MKSQILAAAFVLLFITGMLYEYIQTGENFFIAMALSYTAILSLLILYIVKLKRHNNKK